MYKREGCSIWTIEEKDFEKKILWFGKDGTRAKIGLFNLVTPAKINLFEELDVILELDGKRYLGYLEFVDDIAKGEEKHSTEFINFVICQENYLEGYKIVKEVEY